MAAGQGELVGAVGGGDVKAGKGRARGQRPRARRPRCRRSRRAGRSAERAGAGHVASTTRSSAAQVASRPASTTSACSSTWGSRSVSALMRLDAICGLRPRRLPPRARLALSCERRRRPSSTPTRPPTPARSRCSASSSAPRTTATRCSRSRTPESGEGFALVGPVAHLGAGDRAEVSGDWQTHSRYGRQLRAQGALPLDPADREGQVAYLTSLRHIGPARAERLVDEHGEGVLEAIAADPHGVFGSLRGVSADQAAAAAESWHASRAVRDLHVQLAPHGLAHLAAPIHARYGERSMAVLHEDPYRLTEVDGRRLRPRRQDRPRRRRPARVRAAAPRPPPSSPSPRPSSRATATCRWTS